MHIHTHTRPHTHTPTHTHTRTHTRTHTHERYTRLCRTGQKLQSLIFARILMSQLRYASIMLVDLIYLTIGL